MTGSSMRSAPSLTDVVVALRNESSSVRKAAGASFSHDDACPREKSIWRSNQDGDRRATGTNRQSSSKRILCRNPPIETSRPFTRSKTRWKLSVSSSTSFSVFPRNGLPHVCCTAASNWPYTPVRFTVLRRSDTRSRSNDAVRLFPAGQIGSVEGRADGSHVDRAVLANR